MARIDHAERLRERNEKLKNTPVGGAISSGVESLGRLGSQIGESYSQADLGGSGSGLEAVSSGLGYIGGNMRRSASQLGDYFTSPAQAEVSQPVQQTTQIPQQLGQDPRQTLDSQGNTPQTKVPSSLTPTKVPEVINNSTLDLSGGYQGSGDQFAFKQDPNGGAINIRDRSGKGTVDFGSPEANARMAKKLGSGKGTVSYMDTSKFSDATAAETANKVYQAVQRGDITPAEGLKLHEQTLQNTSFRKQERLDELKKIEAIKKPKKPKVRERARLGYQQVINPETGQAQLLNKSEGTFKENERTRDNRIMQAYSQASPEEKQAIVMRFPYLFQGR